MLTPGPATCEWCGRRGAAETPELRGSRLGGWRIVQRAWWVGNYAAVNGPQVCALFGRGEAVDGCYLAWIAERSAVGERGG